MPVWSESKDAVERVTTITNTIPTTHEGSCWRSRKRAMEPGVSGSSGIQAPDHAARRPVEPTTVRVMSTKTVARETPIRRSRSVLEAKVRSQYP